MLNNSTPNLFCFWTGDNLMDSNRKNALSSLSNTNLNVVFIDKYSLKNFIHPNYPLHPAYNYLSAVHRADYLRTYFMHVYGGAYSDIKFTTSDWSLAFNTLKESSFIASGYTEPSFSGVEGPNFFHKFILRLNYKNLIGNCAYIFKPNSFFTLEWYNNMITVLDKKEGLLKIHPAAVPEDHYNKLIQSKRSMYPLRWTEMLGDIFHPLCYKYKNYIRHDLPPPDFLKSKIL